MKIKISRLTILIFSIFVPIYIIFIFFMRFEDFELAWLPFDWGTNSDFIKIMANWVAPILFCLSWIYFMMLLGNRLAKTIDLMGETSSSISAHYTIFYGICAIVMLISFLIPLFTPIVGVLSFSSLVFTLLTSKVSWNELDDQTKRFVKVLSFIINIPMLLCTIIVVPELISFSWQLVIDFMENFLDPLFFLMKALGVALPIGNFWLLYRNALIEVEGKKGSGLRSNLDIIFVEVIITGFLFFLETENLEIVDILYYAGLLFWILTFTANFIQGRNNKNSNNTHGLPQNPLSLILFGVFWLATTVFNLTDTTKTLIVVGASLVFILVFILVFMGHPDLDDD